jgi:23S rRNA (adenine2030-N6)-methyltransferase
VSPQRSRYRAEAPDYSHRFHAGNVGDVWKHCVLAEVLGRAACSGKRTSYIDTHAGEGVYALAPTGEWTEGIGRIWDAKIAERAVVRYLELVRALGVGGIRPDLYPGSPLFARAVLGASAGMELWERDAAAAERLLENLGPATGARIHASDGLAALVDAVRAAEQASDEVVALVDPPWTQKSDWIAVPDTLASAVRASERSCFILWYPVKSLTRPNAMIARLTAAGVPGAIAEVVTTPLAHQRQRLNGSGVVLVRPPEGTGAALAAAGAAIGGLCATRAGVWSFRAQAWAAA